MQKFEKNNKEKDRFKNLWIMFQIRIQISKLIAERSMLQCIDGPITFPTFKFIFPADILDCLDEITVLMFEIKEKDYVLADKLNKFFGFNYGIQLLDSGGGYCWFNTPPYMI
jgi:hypothetical protein